MKLGFSDLIVELEVKLLKWFNFYLGSLVIHSSLVMMVYVGVPFQRASYRINLSCLSS